MTAHDIIYSALSTQRDAFLASVNRRITDDTEYLDRTKHEAVARSVAASIRGADRVSAFARRQDLPLGERVACIVAETGPAIIALGIACKLLNLSPSQRHAAAATLDEGR